MPIKATILIAIVIILLGLCYWLYVYNKSQNNQIAQQQEIIKTENRKNDRAEISKLFDLYLNNFKADLKNKATEYKNNRKLLKDIFSPYNFETPEYTKENYNMFKTHIAPNLRNKSVEIISIFEEYQKNIKKDLENKNSQIGNTFLKQWQEMSKAQLNNYITFFTNEEELIQAYEELMEFYYVHSNLFKVDLESNKFIFERNKDEETEAILRTQIRDLRKR